ncbi:MAG: ECF-type sigma factor [Gemmatimonadales bacterium]
MIAHHNEPGIQMSPAAPQPAHELDASTEALFLRLYAELRRIADHLLRREAVGHTLQPTALVHEAWFKLAGPGAPEPVDRGHFLALAARAMRQVLVDSARRRRAAKRKGETVHVSIADGSLNFALPLDDLIAVDDALVRLASNDERLARVVELRFFAGLSEDEIAAALNVTTRTVQRDWVKARAWLHSELASEPPAK